MRGDSTKTFLHRGEVLDKHQSSVPVIKLKDFKTRQATTFEWSNSAWTADQLNYRKTDNLHYAICMLHPLCMAAQASEADLSLCHTARRLSRSVALLAVLQDLCPCQRNPEDASVSLSNENAEVAKGELLDISDGHSMQGSWQHWHGGVVPGVL